MFNVIRDLLFMKNHLECVQNGKKIMRHSQKPNNLRIFCFLKKLGTFKRIIPHFFI